MRLHIKILFLLSFCYLIGCKTKSQVYFEKVYSNIFKEIPIDAYIVTQKIYKPPYHPKIIYYLDLYNIKLYRDMKIQGIPCRAGEVHFAEGQIIYAILAKNCTIQGIPCQAGEPVGFHKNGRLWRATLSQNYLIDDVPCQGGQPIRLYKNGSISEATLSREYTKREKTYKKGWTILFHNGRPIVQKKK